MWWPRKKVLDSVCLDTDVHSQRVASEPPPGWAWNEIKGSLFACFVGSPSFFVTKKPWAAGYRGFLMHPLAGAPLCVLLVVCCICLRLGHLQHWCYSCLPLKKFFQVSRRGACTSLLRMWSSPSTRWIGISWTVLLVGLACLHRLVLQGFFLFLQRGSSSSQHGRWFRPGLDLGWGIAHGFLISMVFMVALYVPWCRHLEGLQGATMQLHADNSKCTSHDADDILLATQYTGAYVKVVGRKLVLASLLLSAPRASRRRLKAWHDSSAGQVGPTSSKCHFSSCYGWRPPHGVPSMQGMICAQFLPAGLHGSEAVAVSICSELFRTSVSCAVWPKKLPMTNVPALFFEPS